MSLRVLCCASLLLFAALTPARAAPEEPAPSDAPADLAELPVDEEAAPEGPDVQRAFGRLIPLALGSALGSVAAAALLVGGYASLIAGQVFPPLLITSLLVAAPGVGIAGGVLAALLVYGLVSPPTPSGLALSAISFGAGFGGVLGLFLGAGGGLLSALLLESLFPRGDDCFCYADTYLIMGGAALGGMALGGFALGSVASIVVSSVEERAVE